MCGARQVTRSVFEVDCDECGGTESLVAEDAYDPAPAELRCTSCAYLVDGAGFDGSREEEYAGGLTVDDACPRCGQETLVPRSEATARARSASSAVLAEPEFALARRVAERVLENHWSGEMPVDVWKIAKALEIEIQVGDFKHEGRLEGGVIKVPRAESRTGQRFAIGHEIGHHELRHRVNEDRIEPEANAFASQLLIPRHRLKRAVEAGLSLAKLRELFDVSREAIIHALEDAKLLGKVTG